MELRQAERDDDVRQWAAIPGGPGAPMSGDPSLGDRESIRCCVARCLGAEVGSIRAIPAGLGTRRFYRVRCQGPELTLIARIEAPEDPAGRPLGLAPEPPLEPIRALLEREGLPVPRRLGGDEAGTIDLLEDLGDRSLERAQAESPTRARSWYDTVVGLLPRLQRIAPTPGVVAFERRLDASMLAYKADLFSAWSLPAALGRPARPSEREALRTAFAWIAEQIGAAPRRLAHRDLQSRNILIRDGVPYWIDLQGALLAPPEYDLVCLLRDSYVELPEPWVEELQEAARRELPDSPGAECFQRRFDLLTVVRKAKDHARLLDAQSRRGIAADPDHLATTVRALRRAIRATGPLHPKLEPLADLISGLPMPGGAGR